MKNVLVTGGTVFVSRYVAEYYVKKGYNVYVMNRNTKKQPSNTTLIEVDRHNLGIQLKDIYFDIVLDITAYTSKDINCLLDGLGGFGEYIMLSSSAVYPEYCAQPFSENTELGKNSFWGMYGIDKIAAEEILMQRNPSAYILRPPYLYGPMNNIYREAFVFDCAIKNRAFYIPGDGQMKMQFFHVDDLCRFIDIIIERKPSKHIFNVGNKDAISICEWVKKCYRVAEKEVNFVYIREEVEQREYFPFYKYEYYLDVNSQKNLMPETMDMDTGLRQAYEWYLKNKEEVRRKPFLEYIDGKWRNSFD